MKTQVLHVVFESGNCYLDIWSVVNASNYPGHAPVQIKTMN